MATLFSGKISSEIAAGKGGQEKVTLFIQFIYRNAAKSSDAPVRHCAKNNLGAEQG
ncbi:hypothetical protein [Siccibacter colletis]|uniref:hypothetical protein n=1 Tax=Siccibacter colletis TaxID=1505757 RepID=UPI003CF06918